MGVAFCAASAFASFGDVLVGLNDVGPWDRLLAGRGGGERRRGEGMHGGDKAERDWEETREDDWGGFSAVAIAIIAVLVHTPEGPDRLVPVQGISAWMCARRSGEFGTSQTTMCPSSESSSNKEEDGTDRLWQSPSYREIRGRIRQDHEL